MGEVGPQELGAACEYLAQVLRHALKVVEAVGASVSVGADGLVLRVPAGGTTLEAIERAALEVALTRCGGCRRTPRRCWDYVAGDELQSAAVRIGLEPVGGTARTGADAPAATGGRHDEMVACGVLGDGGGVGGDGGQRVVSGQPNVINPTTLSFTPSPDHATGVTSYRAEWYAAGATAPMMSSDLGKPTPGSTGDISLPIASLIQPSGRASATPVRWSRSAGRGGGK